MISIFDAMSNSCVLLSSRFLSTKNAVVPRIRNLAPLCKFRGNFNMDKLKIAVVGDKTKSIRELATSVLSSYGAIASSPNTFHAINVGRELAIQRLHQLGISKHIVEQVIEDFDVSTAAETEEMSAIIERCIAALTLSLSDAASHKDLVSVEINGLHCLHHALTYDFRVTLQTEEILISDGQLYPLLRVFPDKVGFMDCLDFTNKNFVKSSFAKDKLRQNGKNHRLSKKKIAKMDVDGMIKHFESNTLSAFCGIVLTYTEQDALHGWGYGGHTVKALYKPKHVLFHPTRRAGQLAINVKKIQSILSHSGIPKVAGCLIPLYIDLLELSKAVRKKFLRKFAPHKVFEYSHVDMPSAEKTCADGWNSISFLRHITRITSLEMSLGQYSQPDVALSMHGAVESCRIAGILDDHLLFEVKMSIVKVYSDEKHSTKNVYGQWISIESLEFNDLSLGGVTHSKILWKDSGMSYPILRINVTLFPDRISAKCHVRSMKALILYRQLYEVYVFMSSYFIDPIQEFFCLLSFVSDDNTYESFSTESQSSYESDSNSHDDRSHSSSSTHSVHDRNSYGRGVSQSKNFKSTTTRSSVVWSISLVDTTIFLPRNSTSNDMVAVYVAKLEISERYISETWSSPKGAHTIFESGEVLRFDVAANEWKWSTFSSTTSCGDVASNAAGSEHATCDMNKQGYNLIATPRVSLCDTKRPAFDVHDSRQGPIIEKAKVIDRSSSKLVKLFETATSDNDSSTEAISCAAGNDTIRRQEEWEKNSTPALVTVDSDSEDDFQDTVDVPRDAVESCCDNLFSQAESEFSTLSNRLDMRVHDDSLFSRYVFTCEEVMIFCSLATPLCDTINSNEISYDHRRFAEVRNGSPVYYIQHGGRPISTWSKQVWNQVTVNPFNLCVVWDNVDGQTRLLFSETECASPLSLRASMGEFYLILSAYFDNLAEKEFFFSHIKSTLTKPFNAQADTPKPFGDHPEYGSEAFCAYIKDRFFTWDILVVRGDITFECLMDLNYFSSKLFSQQFLHHHSSHSTRDSWHPETTTFAIINLNWIVVEILMDHEITKVAAGCGRINIRDTRVPKQTFAPVILDISTTDNSSKHGYVDFDFGLKHGPSTVLTPMDIPFKLTYFGVGNTWATCNIGSDSPNFDAKNLDIIWLISDYFSMYFRSAEFCNPSVAAYFLIPKSMWPYGGMDTRIFITRPHIQTVDISASSSDCQTMVISAEVGLYFRYTYDTQGSTSMECHVHDMSAVLLKQYRSPKDARGLRGTAGSGRGIRTLIEFLTVHWSYTFNKPNNYLDMQLSISPPSRDYKKRSRRTAHRVAEVFSSISGKNMYDVDQDEYVEDVPLSPQNKTSFVHFDDERLQLTSVPIFTPKCVSPLLVPARDFPKHCVNVVSSYEDAIFAFSLVSSFLRIDLLSSKSSQNDKVALFSSF